MNQSCLSRVIPFAATIFVLSSLQLLPAVAVAQTSSYYAPANVKLTDDDLVQKPMLPIVQARSSSQSDISQPDISQPDISQPVITQAVQTDGPPAIVVGNSVVENAGQPSDCSDCQQVAADTVKAPEKPKVDPCTTSHKPLFYENDFSYLNQDDYFGNCLGDSLKGIGPCGNVDIGGQIRFRYHSERGMGQQAGATRFENTQNDFLLTRLRLYGNVKVNDRLRFYTEGIFADVLASNPAYVPRGIDQNFGDFLNLFVDLKVNDTATVRVGRQELLFGAQRLVSPLDWANTRRTFDGVRLIQKFEKARIDWFYSQLVRVLPNDWDNSDSNQEFYGVYGTHQLEKTNVDLYALASRDRRGNPTDKSIVTFGSRLHGSTQRNVLYDFEGMVQTGSFATGADFNAYAWTAGLGKKFDDICWKPTLWFFYDYASGNNGVDVNNFDQLYPLAHKYLGFVDAVQRSNIKSPNVQLTLSPAKRLSLLLWYYNFTAADASDIVRSIGGTPAQDLTVSDFGNELDFVATFKASARTNVLAGYSHLWAGDKILSGTDADFFYLQWQTNF